MTIVREGSQAGTVGARLRWASGVLRQVTDVPRLEAEVLLSHVTGLSRATLLAHPDRLLPTNQQTNYQTLVRRCASGYPLPYLTGRIEFYGLEFEVTPETLIPRPETETLVDLALRQAFGVSAQANAQGRLLAHHSSSARLLIADVGAGCGCIAVALAAHLPNATVYAIEIAPAALAVARRNVERHGLAARVRMVAGDVLTPLSGPVHLIVSNPPYVPTGDCASLPVSVRDHEPRLALDGGSDGLSVIRRLLAQAPAKLRSGGRLLVEIGAGQGEAVTSLACAFFPQATIRVHPDLGGRDRVLEVQT